MGNATEMSRREFARAGALCCAAVLVGCTAGGGTAHAAAKPAPSVWSVNERQLERAIGKAFNDARMAHTGNGSGPAAAKELLGMQQAKKLARKFSADGWWMCAYNLKEVIPGPYVDGRAVAYRLFYWDGSAAHAASARKAADKLVRKARKKHPKSKTKQLKYIHDWLVKNVAYATAANAPRVSVIHDELRTSYGALVMKRAYCLGYAAAFSLCAARIGVPSRICMSNTHAWNEVKLSGKWKLVDCTLDDPLVGGKDKSKPRYGYWLKTQAQANKTDVKKKKPNRHVATVKLAVGARRLVK